MASWWRMLPKKQADAGEKDAAVAAEAPDVTGEAPDVTGNVRRLSSHGRILVTSGASAATAAIDTDESKLAPFVDDETKQVQETEPTTMFSKKEKVKVRAVPAPESPTSVDRLPFESPPVLDSASYLKRAIELSAAAAELMTQEHLCGHAHINSPTGTLPFASNL